MGKKGSAHLEMILSFTIFIVAVVFILIFVRPLNNNKLSETVAITLKDSFVNLASINLITVFVNGTTERCMPRDYNLNWTYSNLSGSETHYYAYFSNEFSSGGSLCVGSIDIGSESIKSVLSNKSIYEINKSYYEEYNLLKKDLNLPQTVDFEIYSIDNYLNLSKSAPIDIDIISKKYTFSILDSNGELINREIVFRVW